MNVFDPDGRFGKGVGYVAKDIAVGVGMTVWNAGGSIGYSALSAVGQRNLANDIYGSQWQGTKSTAAGIGGMVWNSDGSSIGRDEEAYAAFYKARWNNGWAAPGYHALAEIAASRSQWQTALDHLDQSLLHGGDNLRARALKARILRELGDAREAESIVRESLCLDPLDPWLRELGGKPWRGDNGMRLDVAFDLARVGFFADAVELLRGADRDARDGSLPMVRYTEAWLLERMGDAAGAKAARRAAPLPGRAPSCRAMRACSSNPINWPNAWARGPARRLRELLRNPDFVRQREDLTVELCALLNQTGQPAKALDLLVQRRFQPWEGGEGQVLGQYVRCRLLLARQCLAEPDFCGAIAYLEAALEPPLNLGEAKHHLLANQSDIHFWLGEAHAAEGHKPAARTAWKRAAEFRGDFQQMMSVCPFSEMAYFS